ncbi:MAG: fasciclin domain-containing protein [Bacteroidota bacterium]|nr:fasciclin domain-containing protein [Bacteroidota bacterium]
MFVVCLTSLFSGCNSDDIGGNLYTFKDETMAQYLKSHPEEYSEFTRLLDTTGVMSLLYTYGEYTCFAPTNDAMYAFYKTRSKNGLSDFSMDTLKMIAYDHLINGTVLMYSDFIEGRQTQLSMSERYFSISYKSTGETYVNGTSLILEKDITVHNGVVHKISEVLNPTREGIVEVISKDPKFKLFYQALLATGMADSLLKTKDDSYDPSLYQNLITATKDDGQWYYDAVPTSRKYGYTVLMESDSTYALNGITDMASLKATAASIYDAVYPDDKNVTDVTDRRNSLNRFISYHLVNKQLSKSLLIDAYAVGHMIQTSDMYEYIETMCPNTLIEVKKEFRNDKTNLINKLPDQGTVINLVNANCDNDATNGVYHEIDNLLVYSKDVENMLSTKRLRFDGASFFPELTNNNMRGYGTDYTFNTKAAHYQIPRGYLDRVTCSEQTVIGYLLPYAKYQDYEGDEIFLNATTGKLYDFTITTPPVPAGKYEIRFGYQTNGKRGVAQLYIDGAPCGVPLNLNKYATDASIGWEEPKTVADDYYGFENDKMMRNRGYMKGPASYKVVTTGWSYGENSRYSSSVLRKILGIYNFSKASTHKLMVKGLSGGEFMFDYLEFVPTSCIESEDIY